MKTKPYKIQILLPALMAALLLCSFTLQDENENQQENDVSPVFLPDSTAADSLLNPGEILDRFIRAVQDSNFVRDFRVKVKPDARFQHDLRAFTPDFLNRDLYDDETLWQSFQRQFEDVPRESFIPLGIDIVQNYENRQRSMAVDGMTTLPKHNTGLQIPFSTISDFLGLSEDVSPTITYDLAKRSEVTVVVYSIQATIVATIINGVQPPGRYPITWNGRDDQGRMMPPGDYVMEVRIGDARYLRKRIKI